MPKQKQIQLSLFDAFDAAPAAPAAPADEVPVALIARRHRQLLVHSFLYYRLGESLVDDPTFDQWRRELADLHRRYPGEASKAPYASICQIFVDSPSGYAIKDYPPEIMSVALHLLHQVRYTSEEFGALCARFGFRLVHEDGGAHR